MLTSDQFDVLTNPMLDLFHDYEISVIEDIARRLVKLDFSSAAWQVQRLTESGALYKDVLKQLSRMTGKSEQQLEAIFKKAGVKAITFDDKIYKEAGLTPPPLNLSPAMLRALEAGLKKTNNILSNLTQSTALTAQQSFFKAADLAYLQVSTGAMSYDQAIRAAVKNVASEGLSTIDYASGHQDHLDVAMRRAVLTGVGQTTGQLQINRADEMGNDLVAVSAHVGARNKGAGPENHQSWQGKIYSRSGNHPKYPNFAEVTGYGTGEGLGGWNCVIGKTEVSGPMPLVGYRRKYSGELVTLRTALGKEITITPNHPILTPQGWVAAGVLTEGDYVICRRVGDGATIISPNNNQSPSRIQDVFNSLGKNGKSLIFFGSSKDFHGDGSDSEINIVFSDSFLWSGIHSLFYKHFIERRFGASSNFSCAFISKSALAQISISAFHSPDSIMGGFSECKSFLGSHSSKSNFHGFGTRRGCGKPQISESFSNQRFGASVILGNANFGHSSNIQRENLIRINNNPSVLLGILSAGNRKTEFSKSNPDNFLTATEMAGEGNLTHSAFVEPDQIIFIQRKFVTSTHVYNLQTTKEWYYANDIITHNCRHSFYPYFENISENAYTREELKSFKKEKVTYNEKKLSVYEGTQVQRAIERKIRQWKREAAALQAAKLSAERELAKIKQWQSAMRDFIKQTDLDRQYMREVIQ